MTDEEFAALDVAFGYFLRRGRRGRRGPAALARALASCRDCETYPSHHYMLPRALWLAVVPGGRGRLCLSWLTRRCAREHAAELEHNLKQLVDPALLSDPEGRA